MYGHLRMDLVQAWMAQLEVGPAFPHAPGTSWLELFYYFQYLGGKLYIDEDADPLRRIPSLAQHMSDFKKAVKAASRTCLEEVDRRFSQPPCATEGINAWRFLA